jgi:hypothetical protein
MAISASALQRLDGEMVMLSGMSTRVCRWPGLPSVGCHDDAFRIGSVFEPNFKTRFNGPLDIRG